jgi:hypothetical protein
MPLTQLYLGCMPHKLPHASGFQHVHGAPEPCVHSAIRMVWLPARKAASVAPMCLRDSQARTRAVTLQLRTHRILQASKHT